jgi:hypothetical protein
MKTTRHYALKFSLWCLILALPYCVFASLLFKLLGASSPITVSIWAQTYHLDGIQSLSLAVFAYIAFLTWPKNPLKTKSKQNAPGNCGHA